MATLDPNSDPRDDLHNLEAAITLGGWWDVACMVEHWPLSTEEAAKLLADGGKYDVDALRLVELVARNLIPKPAVEHDHFEWNASDVIEAGGILELRRQFLAFPCVEHDAKKTEAQIALEQARAGGLVAAIGVGPGRPKFDVSHLLILLLGSDSIDMRANLIAHLKATLEVEHGVFIP